ncbi:MAG: hypothetical protein CL610_22755 [Anaerolineaceae bacterium]|nr:hypothetical protein [Anaerolineaceae bacterium]
MKQLALIIEDEAPLRVIYEMVLAELGFDVIQAVDGEEAMRVLAEQTPNVVVLDILLPKIDGGHILQYIQSSPHLQQTPIIVVTAHRHFETLITLATHDLFLLKPVRPRDIQLAVQRALARS